MVSRAVLERQLRQRIGDHGRLVRWDRPSSTQPSHHGARQLADVVSGPTDSDENQWTTQLIDIAMRATNDLSDGIGAREMVPDDAALYWLEDGPPTTFSWPGFRPAPIVVSRRDVEISTSLEQMLGPDAHIALIRPAARRFFLQYLAAVFMREGDPVTAVQLFTASLTIDPTFRLPGTHSTGIEQAVAGHYSLAHELGHVGADRVAHIVPLEAVLLRHRHVLDDHDANPVVRTLGRLRHRHTLKGLGHRSSIEAAHLRDEMIADKVGALAMFHTTARMELAAGREPDVWRIALAILRMHKARHLMQVVEDRVARMCHPWEEVVDPLMEKASHARLHEVGTALAETLAATTENDFGWDVGALHRELLQLDAELHHRYELVSDGLNEALAQVIHTTTAGLDLAERAGELLDGGDDRYRALAIPAVEDLAESAGRQERTHVDVEPLRGLVRGETTGSARAKYFLTFRRGTRYRLPIVLWGKGNVGVSFVFESGDSSRYQRWTRAAVRAYGTKVVLEHETLTCDWDWQISARLQAAIPGSFQRAVRLVFEGTEVFDRLWHQVETSLSREAARAGSPSSLVRLKEVPWLHEVATSGPPLR